MSANTEFEMSSIEIRKRVVRLRHVIDQGEFSADEDVTILSEAGFTEDELEWIEENENTLFGALLRVEKQYNALDDLSNELELSQSSLDAFVVVLALEEHEAEQEDDDEPEGEPEDEEPGIEDPDADLE